MKTYVLASIMTGVLFSPQVMAQKSKAIVTSCSFKDVGENAAGEQYTLSRTYSLMNRLFDDVYLTKNFSVTARGTDTPNTSCVAAVTKEPDLIQGDELQPYCTLLKQAQEILLQKNQEANKKCWELYENTHRPRQ